MISELLQDELVRHLIKLLLAALLGALIGFERDLHGRSAGLRTHLLVAMGACLFMLISQNVSGGDPSRIAAQIVSGIGFLGAGAIMKEGINVRGLTTASCLWIAAAVGMAVGIGQFSLALTTTVIALIAVSMLNNVDRFFKRESYRVLSITTLGDTDTKELLELIESKDIHLQQVDYDHDMENDKTILRVAVKIKHRKSTDFSFQKVFDRLQNSSIPISRVTWKHGKLS